ncbi:MAG TPA: multiheme c-type cytochrome, partial [Polyangiaceae bacterium]|nr:multiheme c-type cytochrome [Polyangiaceae bacterium]
MRTGMIPSRAFPLSAVAAAVLACSDDGEPPPTTLLTREELMDPLACASCHEKHYQEWASSMHAYAADDPLFVAMNAR